MKEKIFAQAKKIHNKTIEWRRHLHKNPELSFQEYKTAQYIADQLKLIGISDFKKMAETGLVINLKGEKENSGKVIALRADIDALPITEENQVEYSSSNKGVMHACGHDVHTSSLLATLSILNDLRNEWAGTIKFIFQPGEEKIPGGASIMIGEGVLKDPIPDSIIAQHVMPFLPAGKVGFRSGLYMASADEIYIRIIGKGGHAAAPDKNVDPIMIASQMLVSLQQVVSRKALPQIPSVLSFGKIIGMGATNVIPNEVNIEGTFRTLDEDWRAKAHELIKEMAEGIAKSFGGKCEIEVRKGYPHLKNHPGLSSRLKEDAVAFLGEENVIDLDIWMAGEDFSYYSQITDACFYRLGTGNESKGIISGVHTPTFDIDESALVLGPALMSWLAVQELSRS
jgi:amidohydrolase